MKKFSIFIILIIVCVFCFAGCVNTPKTASDLGDCKVGYEFEVYPNVEFNYKINDDCVVHINNISVTLVKKNEINTGDTIEGLFYPYTAKMEVSGHTDASYFGKKINVQMTAGINSYSCDAIISEDGTFYGFEEFVGIKNTETLYFNCITFVIF